MRPPVRATATALALALSLLALPACGRSDEDEVRDSVEAFGQATARKDYQALCDEILSRELVDKLKMAGLPCEQALQVALEQVRQPRVQIQQVTVTGDQARALVRTTAAGQEGSTDAIALVKESRGWRVDSLAAPQVPRRSRPPAP